MLCQKTITEPVIGRKRTCSAVLEEEVDGEFDHNNKKPKISGHASWDNKVDCNKRRVRAALIRSRFAETILKSQEKIIQNESSAAEKKILKKKKANVEAKIRASKMELNIHRQKQRQAARLALDKIPRTVEWNDALQVVEEFEKLIDVRPCPL